MRHETDLTQKAAEALADEFKQLIFKRTGLSGQALVCPREKSDMTPCLARDGRLVVVFDSFGKPICVGCETRLIPQLEKERAKC
jgi:hypothetical protein